MPIIRINKYLADSGVSSRRKSEEYISQGRVAVNDKIIIDFSQKVDTEKDVVTLDGEKIKIKRHIYLLLNKPKGYITTVSDDRNRSTVLDLVKVKERIYPVGRLDYNTTGLLFLTNDGDFSQLLTHPGNKIPREYEVILDKPLEENDKLKLLKGIRLDGKPGKFLKLIFPEQKNKKYAVITCEEGRNKFVKRMFGRLEYTVVELNRVSYAGVYLDIPPGKSRNLTSQEIQLITNKYSH